MGYRLIERFLMSFCGLDFGTSNSTIGVAQQQQIRMVPLDADKTTLRSAIFINDEEQCMNFGRDAMSHYTDGMEGRLLMSLKSVLGSSLMQEKTRVLNQMQPFTAILGHFIQYLKNQAEQFKQSEIDSVVCGRPVYFKDGNPELDKLAQDTLETILRSVGFKHIKFQFEPIAASAFYKKQIRQEQLVLIIDLGGGTSDFCLIRMNPHNPASLDDIIAADGIHIGGNDFDKLLNYEKVSPHLGRGTLMRALNGSDLEIPSYWYHDLATWHKINFLYGKQTLIDIQQIYTQAHDKSKLARLVDVIKYRYGHQIAEHVEACKIQFSTQNQTDIDLSFIDEALFIPASKTEFADLLQNDLLKLEQTIQHLLNNAGVKSEAINTVFFTGGSSKIDAIQQHIMRLFSHAQKMEGDYFNSVGMGLTIEAQEIYNG